MRYRNEWLTFTKRVDTFAGSALIVGCASFVEIVCITQRRECEHRARRCILCGGKWLLCLTDERDNVCVSKRIDECMRGKHSHWHLPLDWHEPVKQSLVWVQLPLLRSTVTKAAAETRHKSTSLSKKRGKTENMYFTEVCPDEMVLQ